MGNSSSSSSVSIEQDNTIINRSTINSVNEMYNKAVVNTTIETVQECSASLIQGQNITLENLVIAGDIDLDLSQLQEALVDFSCTQQSEVQNEVANKLTAQIMQDLEKSTSTDVFTKLNAQAQANSKADFGSFPWSGADSSSKVNQKIKNHIENVQTTNLKNVVNTAVYSNFTNLTESKCVSKIVQSQNIGVKGITGGGDFSFTADQKQTAQMFANCVQQMDVSNKIINDVTKFIGIKVKEDTKTTAETEASATAEAISVVLGPIGAVGDAIGNIFPEIPELGALGSLVPASGSLSLCCCCLIMIVVLVMLLK